MTCHKHDSAVIVAQRCRCIRTGKMCRCEKLVYFPGGKKKKKKTREAKLAIDEVMNALYKSNLTERNAHDVVVVVVPAIGLLRNHEILTHMDDDDKVCGRLRNAAGGVHRGSCEAW